MKTILKLFGISMLFLVVANTADASTYFAGENYTLPAGQSVSGNLYAGGGNVAILGSVSGDAVVGGGKVLVNGPVSGDILAGSGNIDILAPVGGDVRSASGDITIGANVGGDVFVAGGTVQILAGTVVNGDVMVAGGTITIDGTVNGNVTVYGGEVSLGGAIKGNAHLRGNQKLTIGTGATVGGTLLYESPSSLDITEGSVAGGVTYKSTAKQDVNKGAVAALAVFLGTLFLIGLGGTALGSVFFATAFQKDSLELMEYAVTRFGTAVLVGLVFLVIVPIAAILMMFTIVGIVPAVFVLLTYILFLMVAKVYACILVGAFLSHRFKGSIHVNWKWALLGTVLLALVTFVPVLGPIVGFLFTLAALGALAERLRNRWKTRNDGEMKMEIL